MSQHSTFDSRSVRNEVDAWIDTNWDPELPLLEWRERLVTSGWMVPSWPTKWFGRGLAASADRIVADALRDRGAPGAPIGSGMSLAAPTLLEHASDQLNRDLIRPTITGAITWCQLFSEPGAGSDLASLSTTATLDGDEWVLNGQKVWNTSAHHADFAIVVARSDWDAPKHRGISYFVLPMGQAGVEVRGIKQMNRHASFNEVFLTNARLPAHFLVGDRGDGWRIARTTLAHERSFATLRRPSYRTDSAAPGRAVREAEAEADEHFATYVWYPQRAGRADLLIPRAQEFGLDTDPRIRDAIGRVAGFQRANEWTALRARSARALGRPPGPEGSIGKLAASELARRSAKTHGQISGAHGMLDDGAQSTVAEVLVSTPAQSIAGGTDEIQRNIIGENILGLPREPSHDRETPFRDLPR
ncbi:MAG: acyl-CoA dehydrogenase family protein [Ilumatobacteraceae bacterium]